MIKLAFLLFYFHLDIKLSSEHTMENSACPSSESLSVNRLNCRPRVAVGECVMVRLVEPDSYGNILSPAEILAVWERKEKAQQVKMVEVRWLYYPEEIPKTRLKSGAYEEGELFESNHVDEIEADSIEMNIRVLDEFTYEEDPTTLEEVDGQRVVFFCRRHYDVDLKSLRPVLQTESRMERGNLYSKRQRETFLSETASAGSPGRKRLRAFDQSPPPKNRTELPVDEMLRRLNHNWVPKKLPCRTGERMKVARFILEGLKKKGLDQPLYISGMPGTGKTATVLEIVSELRRGGDEYFEVPSFDFVEVNGMKLAHPNQAYPLIWQGLTGQAGVSPKRAFKNLEARFTKEDPERKACLLFVDELDYMVERSQNVLFNLFNWPSKPHANLVVVGIANTMNLPEQLLSKVSSRMGAHRLVFKPYTRDQVERIITDRIGDFNAFNPAAVRMIGMKVAGCAGDVRRALQICRRALFLAIGRKKPGEKVELTTKDVQQAAKEILDSPVKMAIKAGSLFDKLFLIAMACEQHARGKEQLEFQRVKGRFMTFLQREFSKDFEEMAFLVHQAMEKLKVSGIVEVLKVKMQRDPVLSLSNSICLNELVSIFKQDDIVEKYLPPDLKRTLR